MADVKNTPFKYFSSLSVFNNTKVSANATNTRYALNGLEYPGTPYIQFTDICFIGDKDQPKIWNRGIMYDCSPSSDVEIDPNKWQEKLPEGTPGYALSVNDKKEIVWSDFKHIDTVFGVLSE